MNIKASGLNILFRTIKSSVKIEISRLSQSDIRQRTGQGRKTNSDTINFQEKGIESSKQR